MARIGQQVLGTKLKLPSRKELEEGKYEACGFQQRKSVSDLELQGRLVDAIPPHPHPAQAVLREDPQLVSPPVLISLPQL